MPQAGSWSTTLTKQCRPMHYNQNSSAQHTGCEMLKLCRIGPSRDSRQTVLLRPGQANSPEIVPICENHEKCTTHTDVRPAVALQSHAKRCKGFGTPRGFEPLSTWLRRTTTACMCVVQMRVRRRQPTLWSWQFLASLWTAVLDMSAGRQPMAAGRRQKHCMDMQQCTLTVSGLANTQHC